MTKYARGASFEYAVKAHLEKRGWYIIRSAGSHGVADLVALRRDKIPLMIQCKISASLPKKERVELKRAARAAGAKAVLAYRDPDTRKITLKKL